MVKTVKGFLELLLFDRFGQKADRAFFIGINGPFLNRHHVDRDMPRMLVGLERFQHLPSVHGWKFNVKDDRIRNTFSCQGETIPAVC